MAAAAAAAALQEHVEALERDMLRALDMMYVRRRLAAGVRPAAVVIPVHLKKERGRERER